MAKILNSQELEANILEGVPVSTPTGPLWVNGTLADLRVSTALPGSAISQFGPGAYSLEDKVFGVRGTILASFITGQPGSQRVVGYLTDNLSNPANRILIGVDAMNRPFISIRNILGDQVVSAGPTNPSLPANYQITILLSWDSTQAIDGVRFARFQLNRAAAPENDWNIDPTSPWTPFRPTHLVLVHEVATNMVFNGEIVSFQVSNQVDTSRPQAGQLVSNEADRFVTDALDVSDVLTTITNYVRLPSTDTISIAEDVLVEKTFPQDSISVSDICTTSRVIELTFNETLDVTEDTIAQKNQLSGPGVHTYSFTGSNSGQTCSGRYWFPDGYDPADPIDYPIIVALHGKGGSGSTTNTNFIPELQDAITAGQIRKCIVVMPDSNGADWYTDATGFGTGTVLAETKLIDDVIPFFQEWTRYNGTLLGTGFSMGGWGISANGMRHIGLFDAVWVCGSPNSDANPTSGTVNNWRWINDVFSDIGANDTDDVQAIWGPTSTGQEQIDTRTRLEADSPFATKNGGALANQFTASIISSLPLYLSKSAADGTSLAHMNQASVACNLLNIPHSFIDLVTPTHNQGQYYQAAQATSSIAAGNGFMWLEAALNGADVIAPRISGTPTVNTAGTQVTITFDKTLVSNSPTAAQFTLGGTFATVASASASGTTVTLTLNHIIASGATVTVSMASAEAAVKVQSAAGVPAGPRSAVAVTNSSTATPLTIVTSVSAYWWLLVASGNVTESGGSVSQVNDLSGNARHFTQGTSLNRPTFSTTSGPNSGAGITMDGSEDFLVSPSIDLPAPGTTNFYDVFVLKQVTWVANDRIVSHPSGTLQIRQAGTTPALTMNNTTGVNSNTAATLNNWFWLAAKFTGSTSDSLEVGTTLVTGASAGTNDPASGSSSIGAVAGGSTAANFVWCERVSFAGTPTGTEITNLKKYVFGRYGSTVTV